MTADPPDSAAVGAAFATALVDEWARAGVRDAVVAPGSRSGPLALALVRDGRLRVHVVIDERSAAFFALGVARASLRPVVVCCTSGTAGAHFHPAVIEADLSGVPLLVCTANRPPELLDTGAGQTIDQLHLFGRSVRWFAAPGPPVLPAGASAIAEVGAVWRSVAARAVAEALGPPAGPIHLDLAFREPLVSAGEPFATPGRPDGQPWTTSRRGQRRLGSTDVARLATRLEGVERGLLVAGWGAGARSQTAIELACALGWPLLADPISGLREGPHAISTYDALLRVARFASRHRPDLVVRIGAPLTSKVATAWLDPSIEQIVVDPDARWLDPQRAARERLTADAEPLFLDLVHALPNRSRESAWLADWRGAEHAARAAIDALLDGDEIPFDARVARDVYAAVPDGGSLLVASSMPVREVEWFAAPRGGLRVHANRGANGIDGLVSTTLGVATGGAGPTVGLLGDLAWLHDSNGLLAARAADATFVVLDNGGGGIFHFLPVSRMPELDDLFVTPQTVDPIALARAYGLEATRVERSSEVGSAVRGSIDGGGVRLVVVPTDRHSNVRRHEAVWSAVADAVA
jgi:2-succinyl-5-enolpyruvyl-6-hydroxy-3-cyclohexene-1-carboxylate synthase